jgi:IS6 family transposase
MAGNSCRKPHCTTRWGLSAFCHYTFALARPAGHLRESCMRENCTCSLSGGRRPASRLCLAPPPTRLRVAGRWTYLYRAIDSLGNTIDFLLSPNRDLIAAKGFLQLALSAAPVRPRIINVNGHPAYATAVAELKDSGELSRRCRCRPSPYLNNIIEQDHRFVKKRITASQGFRSVEGALSTIAGYEAMNIIRKGQIRWLPKGDVRGQKQFIERLLGIAA